MGIRSNWFNLFSMNLITVTNSNFLKHCIIFISITWALPEWITRSQLIAIESAALVLPYVFLSPIAGKWAKSHYKTTILKITKSAEIPIVLLAALSFYTQNIIIAIIATFLLGIQASLISPAKYGTIHDIDGDRGAAFGSGIFEAMAFCGILVGTIVASLIADHYSLLLVASVLVILAVVGYFNAINIKTKETEPSKDTSTPSNPISYIMFCHRIARNYVGLTSSIFGSAFFWFIGSLLQMNIVLHTTKTMNLSNTSSGIVLACAAIGIALGCFISGKLIDRVSSTKYLRIIGLLGIIVGATLLAILPHNLTTTIILIVFTAAFGGIFQIPCLTSIQRTPLGRNLPIIMAHTNIITFTLIVLSSGIFSLITYLSGESSTAVFVAISAITSIYLILDSILRGHLRIPRIKKL